MARITQPSVRTKNEQALLFCRPCRIDTCSIAVLFGSTCCSTRRQCIAAASFPDPAPALRPRCPASARADAQAGLRPAGSGRKGRLASAPQCHAVRRILSVCAHSRMHRCAALSDIERRISLTCPATDKPRSAGSGRDKAAGQVRLVRSPTCVRLTLQTMSNLNPQTVLSVRHWTDTLFRFTCTRHPSFRFETASPRWSVLKSTASR
jgi:hypothetical protein